MPKNTTIKSFSSPDKESLFYGSERFFIDPGVSAKYSYITKVSEDAAFLILHSRFKYDDSRDVSLCCRTNGPDTGPREFRGADVTLTGDAPACRRSRGLMHKPSYDGVYNEKRCQARNSPR